MTVKELMKELRARGKRFEDARVVVVAAGKVIEIEGLGPIEVLKQKECVRLEAYSQR